MNALTRPVSTALFRKLSGFQGYPKAGPGELHFIETFEEVSISVDHARAIIKAFDTKMPTIRDIHDTALNLRPKFEPQVDQRAEWEKQYGKPDPNWSKNLVGGSHERNKRRMLWQAIRDTVYYTEGPGVKVLDRIEDRAKRFADKEFWTRQALRLRENHPDELVAFRSNELSRGWDDLLKEDWANEVQPPKVEAPREMKRITQADFDALETDSSEDRWE